LTSPEYPECPDYPVYQEHLVYPVYPEYPACPECPENPFFFEKNLPISFFFCIFAAKYISCYDKRQ